MHVDLGEPGERKGTERDRPEVRVARGLDHLGPPLRIVEDRPCAVELGRRRLPVVEHVGRPLTRRRHQGGRPLAVPAAGVVGGRTPCQRVDGHAPQGQGPVPEVADDGEPAPPWQPTGCVDCRPAQLPQRDDETLRAVCRDSSELARSGDPLGELCEAAGP